MSEVEHGMKWIAKRVLDLSHRDGIKVPIAEPVFTDSSVWGPPDAEGLSAIKDQRTIHIHSKHHVATRVFPRADIEDCWRKDFEVPEAPEARSRVDEILLDMLKELKAKEAGAS